MGFSSATIEIPKQLKIQLPARAARPAPTRSTGSPPRKSRQTTPFGVIHGALISAAESESSSPPWLSISSTKAPSTQTPPGTESSASAEPSPSTLSGEPRLPPRGELR